MKIFSEPARADWTALVDRARDDDSSIEASVREIVADVRAFGDVSLKEFSRRIDQVELESLRVGEGEIAAAEALVDEKLKQAIKTAAANIRAFHEAQIPAGVDIETSPGVRCVMRHVPIRRVGLYVPGGSAPLFSTVLMLAIPASVAGCGEVVLCTPPRKDGSVAPAILYAASLCGVRNIYKVGGAQAVAAMAYGTQSIPRVDKIFGPGNRWVTAAKTILGGVAVAIDMPAGPSEVMVLADGTARAEFVAADVLSQAEHGADSQAVVVTCSEEFAQKVSAEVERQTALLPRASLVEKALYKSYIAIFAKRGDMIAFANGYAPEHLILSVENPWEAAGEITTAGSTFIGNHTPESAGDYASGTNHTLPTAGWARAYGGVSTASFMRTTTIQEATPAGIAALSQTIITMAEAEGLDAHAAAVKVRINGDD